MLTGLEGSDTTDGDGNDVYSGGGGSDTYDLSGTTAAATINLATGRASSLQTGNDLLLSIENVFGSQGANTITGNGGANVLDGLGGNDTINAGGGADRITGGAGDDTMNGGSGNDTFVFAAGFGADIINGFDANSGSGGAGHARHLGIPLHRRRCRKYRGVRGMGRGHRRQHDGPYAGNTINLVGVNGTAPNIITAQDFIFVA